MNLQQIPRDLVRFLDNLSRDQRAVAEACIGQGARSEQEILYLLLQAGEDDQLRNSGSYFDPTREFNGRRHEKQCEIVSLCRDKRIVFALAGNRTGKTKLGAFMTACHLTGIYPEWWKRLGGFEFKYPIKAYACATSRGKQLEVVQPELIGQWNRWGIGSMIPADRIKRVTPLRGVPNGVDTVEVAWGKSGNEGVSILTFKAYEQTRTAFESSLIDWIWNDEEVWKEIFFEQIMRMFGNQFREGGRMFNSFTPLQGMTDVYKIARYSDTEDEDIAKISKSASIGVVRMSWADNPYLSDQEIEEMKRTTPERERIAREHGIAVCGESAIFDLPHTEYTEDWFEIPPQWPFGAGLDHGFDHPTGIVWGAHDRQSDIVHVYREWKLSGAAPELVKAILQSENNAKPYQIFADKSGKARIQAINGRTLFDIYSDIEIYMTPAEKNIEVGVADLQNALRNGKLKIFKTLPKLIEEKSLYHRKKNNQITDEFDDLIDAERYMFQNKWAFGFRDGVAAPSSRRHSGRMRPGSWKTR